MLADLIAEALGRHRVESVPSHPTRTTWSWRYECGCGRWVGEPFVMGEVADQCARAAAELHQAEQVAQTLAGGTPAVVGEVRR